MYTFGCNVHTPMVPFTIMHFNACAGIMVTASHNPKEDNGLKMYNERGCQIRGPMDEDVARKINENRAPWEDYSKVDVAVSARHPHTRY